MKLRKLCELPFNPKLKERARLLRKAGNIYEVKFWLQVKNKKFHGLDFDRQRIIGNYIVDFYCHKHLLIIEIDGSSHNEKAEYDAERDNFIESLGLRVLHFNVQDIESDMEGVLKQIENFISTTPSRQVGTPLHS